METIVKVVSGDKIEQASGIVCKCGNVTKKTMKLGSLSAYFEEDANGDTIEELVSVSWYVFCDDCTQKVISFLKELRGEE